MASIRIWLLLALLQTSTCQPEAAPSVVEGDGEEVSGRSSSRSRDESPSRLLTLKCTNAKSTFFSMYHPSREPALREIYLEFNRSSSGFHKKAVPNHLGSVCEGMEVTCCKPAVEKSAEKVVNDEYHFYYHKIFESHSQSCVTPGKTLYRSMIEIIQEVIKEVELRVNESLGLTLPKDTFENLSRYLISFSSVPDICPLPRLVNAQTRTLIKLTLFKMFGNDRDLSQLFENPTSLECMKNNSFLLIEKYHKEILSSLERELHTMGVLVRSLKMAHQFQNRIQFHTFSRSCITAITRMRYCAVCGGSGKFSPCLYTCLNTLQGCFVDLVEMHGDFVQFTSALRTLSRSLIAEFTQEKFIDGYLGHFVSIVDELRGKEDLLKEIIMTECSAAPVDTRNEDDEEVTFTRRKRAGSIFQTIQGDKNSVRRDPILEQLDLRLLETVIEAELGCLERVGRTLKEVPDKICYLGDYKVANTDNDKCWTGTSLGSYNHPRAGIFKADQAKNPIYAQLRLPAETQYTDLISQIHAATARINATIQFRQLCLQSDDEDCTQSSYQHCNKPATVSPLSSGSGSGSGFGSGSGSGSSSRKVSNGFEDYEKKAITEGTPYPRTQASNPFDNVVRDQMQRTSAITRMPSTANPFTLGTILIHNRDKDAKPVTFNNRLSEDEYTKHHSEKEDKNEVSTGNPTTVSTTAAPEKGLVTESKTGSKRVTGSLTRSKTVTESETGSKIMTVANSDAGIIRTTSSPNQIVTTADTNSKTSGTLQDLKSVSSSPPLHQSSIFTAMTFLTALTINCCF